MSIVDRIKALADEKGTTLAGLERALSLSHGSMRKWDTSSPSIDKVDKVAKHFNVSLDYLLEKTDIRGSYIPEPNTVSDERLSDRDKRDIAKNLEKIVADLDDETAGPLFYGGELPDEDKEILKGILEQALVIAKVKNKAKYTPKKYRNDPDQPDD